ncbi:peptidase [Arsenophonus sp. aPb]|uniref:peptidase n=1 Tax=Arsenophonus sp. aPb TaxID=3041619 RepID=UPI0024684EFB|nr:peptidase [Arsenophonus sp. aPb]WGL97361.1 peptidase [Arsenophonus sp. aPb]
MNLFERLLDRRLCDQLPAEGGDAGGANTPIEKPAAAVNAPPANSNDNEATNKSVEVKPNNAPENPINAPDKYDFKVSEGQQLDVTAVKEFEPIARELDLSNEQAQKLVDLYGAKIMPQVIKQQAEQWQQQIDSWVKTVNEDQQLGSVESINHAQKALKKFGSPDLKQYLNDTGLGNHPELIRVFANIGQAMAEDSMVTGNINGQISAADVLFGDSK